MEEVLFVDTKVCYTCHEVKSKSSFFRRKECIDGLNGNCKACLNLKQVQWKLDNPDKVEKIRARRSLTRKSSGQSRSHLLKYNYSLTVEDFNTMFESQQGCCAICLRHQTELKKILFVDHCHITNKVRQLLCQSCNSMLGYSKDSMEVLQAGINYLKLHGGY